MKSIKPAQTIQKIEHTIFIKIIKNINEIGLNSTKNKKKRSFSNQNYYKEDSNSKLLKLSKSIKKKMNLK